MTTEPINYQVGDLLHQTIWSDTTVYEVIKTTPHTMTLRKTMDAGRALDTGEDSFDVYVPVKPNPNGQIARVRRRKNGSFSLKHCRGSLSPVRRINGIPVRYVDYSF